MTWVRLDDGFCDHPKIALLPIKARWVHLHGLCYCNRFLTDGFVPIEVAHRWEGSAACATLVVRELWELLGTSYFITGYLEWNPSRADVEREREIGRRRKALTANPDLVAAIKERDGSRCRYCGTYVSWKDRKSARGGTYDHVIPITMGGSDGLTNIVVACRGCNIRKGGRTPQEAGMELRLPEGSGNHSDVYIGAERSRLEEEELFLRFYETFPRHMGRRAASQAFAKALRRGGEPGVLIAAAQRYRDDPKRSVDFTALPATWLNQDRWLDEPEVARANTVEANPAFIVGTPEWKARQEAEWERLEREGRDPEERPDESSEEEPDEPTDG